MELVVVSLSQISLELRSPKFLVLEEVVVWPVAVAGVGDHLVADRSAVLLLAKPVQMLLLPVASGLEVGVRSSNLVLEHHDIVDPEQGLRWMLVYIDITAPTIFQAIADAAIQAIAHAKGVG